MKAIVAFAKHPAVSATGGISEEGLYVHPPSLVRFGMGADQDDRERRLQPVLEITLVDDEVKLVGSLSRKLRSLALLEPVGGDC